MLSTARISTPLSAMARSQRTTVQTRRPRRSRFALNEVSEPGGMRAAHSKAQCSFTQAALMHKWSHTHGHDGEASHALLLLLALRGSALVHAHALEHVRQQPLL